MPDNRDRDDHDSDRTDRETGKDGDSDNGDARRRGLRPMQSLSDQLKLEVDILASASGGTKPGGAPLEPAPAGSFGVLVVDDDPDMRSYILRCLGTEDEIGLLAEARDGAEALAFLRSGDFHLVVCDVVMPVMDGLELCLAIRADSKLDHTEVLLVTGELSSRAAREQALEAGASGVLAKPFNAQTLCDRVLRMLRSRGPPPP